MKYHSRLDINWKMPSPPLKANQWFLWNQEHFGDSHKKALSKEVYKPAPNISLIEQALKQKLPRNTGWEAGPDLSPDQCHQLQTAAKVYKRGVPFKKSGQTEPSQTELSGRYPILWPDSGDETPLSPLIKLLKTENAFVLADENLTDQHPDLKPWVHYFFRPHENIKNLETVTTICRHWNEHHPQTTSFIIIGGGVTCDLGAFASALCERPFTLVPGTLLAMADACVGGKTGVNVSPFGKNLAGLFAFPENVLIFTHLLTTLSPRDYLSGASECLKHALLDPAFSQREQLARALTSKSAKQLEPWLPEIVSLKARIVEEDPAENHKRAVLNLGHTLAHALEAVSHQQVSEADTIRHGEAVAIGLLFSVFLSWKLKILATDEKDAMIRLMLSSGIICTPETLSTHLSCSLSTPSLRHQLWAYICNDKKSDSASDSVSFWILLKGFGNLAQTKDGSYKIPVTRETFESVFTEFSRLWDSSTWSGAIKT